MQRINGHYLYSVGYQIHPLTELRISGEFSPNTYGDVLFLLVNASHVLASFLDQSVFNLKTSVGTGRALLQAISEVREKIFADNATFDLRQEMDWADGHNLRTSAIAFETVLSSEIALMDTYLVAQKGGYDTSALINSGINLFPAELIQKVPEAVADINQATRCLAFELATASAFHLFRAIESVVKRYLEVVAKSKISKLSQRSLGMYIAVLDKSVDGDLKVVSALKQLKDLHRNPLIHPDADLDIEDALSLTGMSRSLIAAMLKHIPQPSSPSPLKLGA